MYRGGQQPSVLLPPPGGLPDPMLVNVLSYAPPSAPGAPPTAAPQWSTPDQDPYAAPAPGGPPVNAYLLEQQQPPLPPPPSSRIMENADMAMNLPPPANYGPLPSSDVGPTAKLDGHMPLARCRVLYIGTAIPTETSEGIKAVQEPLRKRYVTDEATPTSVPGVDAWLTVFSSGLLLQYIGDRNKPADDYVTWLPIHTLHLSAAVKCIPQLTANNEHYCEFVPLDSPSAQQSDHPPIFATIMRRTKGVKVLECHAFICKSSQAAMSLVQWTIHAYDHKEGWMEDEPPKYMQTLEGTLDTQNDDAQPTVPLFQPSTDQARDRPNTKSNGYFLLLDGNNRLIKSYNIQHPNKLPPARRQPPPVVPAEPVPSGALVPAPSQYLADFDDLRGYPVFEFPGLVSQEKYKATMRQIRKQRGRIIPDDEPKVPPPPPPRANQAESQIYLAPTRYDYQDELGNYYYVGGEDGVSNRPRMPEQQNADDVAYLAVPLRQNTTDYGTNLVATAPPDERRPYSDRDYERRGGYMNNFANVAGYYP